MDEVFKALADPSRRQLLDSLQAEKGQTLNQLCSGLDMARQSVSKHLAVLEAANLVTSVRRGREKLHYVNAAPIHDITERWISRWDRARVGTLADLKRSLETPMDKPSFVYTSYIRTTPERLWAALTEPDFIRQWWTDTSLITDWKVGSTMVWDHHGVMIEDPEQVVLEHEPYTRLSYTWHSFLPEVGEAVGMDPKVWAQCGAEQRSRVTFELTAEQDKVKLTVVHDEFEPGSLAVTLVNGGWPSILSDLKSLLEGVLVPS